MKKIAFIYLFTLVSICYCQTFNWATQAPVNSYVNAGNDISTDTKGNVYITSLYGHIIKYDSSGIMVWTQSLSGVTILAGSTDDLGCTYITGTFGGTTSFGAISLTANGSGSEYFLAKYDANGICLWAVGAGPGLGNAVKIDKTNNNNLFVAGRISSTCTFGDIRITSSQPNTMDNFIAKYNSTGQCIWVRQTSGSSIGLDDAIDIDSKGSVYIIGNYNLPLTFMSSSSPITLSSNGSSIFLAKYNATGSLIWAKRASNGYCLARDMFIDSSENLMVTGRYSHNISLDSLSLSCINSNAFIAKYDTMGMIQWLQQPSNLWGDGYGIAASQNGIYLTGIFENNGTYSTIIKFDINGNEKWQQGYVSSGNSIVTGRSVSADMKGNIYNAGEFYGAIQFGSFNLNKAFNGNDRSIFVTKIFDNKANLPVTVVKSIKQLTNFELYPNPSSGVFQINFTANYVANLKINIVDVRGKIVYSNLIQNVFAYFTKEIDLSKQSNGVYFVEIIADEKRYVKKIVLE